MKCAVFCFTRVALVSFERLRRLKEILETQPIFSLSVPERRLPAFCFDQKLAFYMTYLVILE